VADVFALNDLVCLERLIIVLEHKCAVFLAEHGVLKVQVTLICSSENELFLFAQFGWVEAEHLAVALAAAHFSL